MDGQIIRGAETGGAPTDRRERSRRFSPKILRFSGKNPNAERRDLVDTPSETRPQFPRRCPDPVPFSPESANPLSLSPSHHFAYKPPPLWP
jgi:hypothetical protein